MIPPIPYHKHTGTDGSPQIESSDLEGYPIVRSVPTHNAKEGTILLYWDGDTTYTLYARINRGWRAATLT